MAEQMRFGAFVAPFHSPKGNPTLQLRRDIELAAHLDELGFDEIWYGEHHSGAYETIASPELMIAAAAERTHRIRFGTGVNSVPYHHPYILADRIMQLDHLTRGRVMLGVGPGQLPSDAFMMGIDPRRQRDMMVEATEVMLPLLRGEVVSRTTDWFTVDRARLQLSAYNPGGIEVAVASMVSAAGATLAGRLGLGMLSLGATDARGFDALDTNWAVREKVGAEHGHPADRSQWRVVASMHLAETREQAMAEVRHGILDLMGYMEGMSKSKLPFATSPEAALDHWTTHGLPVFGVPTIGTPDDAVATIERLVEKTGGFGCFMFLANNCATWEATKRSYALFAEHVIPAVRRMNVRRMDSIDYVGDNSAQFFGAMQDAVREAIAKYSPRP
jgi:limonene 1,2-monooxygenase